MILEGLKIMVLGMGTVFVMLTTLIIATMIASRVIAAFEGAPSDQVGTNDAGGKPLAAIITAAVALFRRQSNQK